MGRVEPGIARPSSTGSAVQRHHKQLTNSAKPGYKVILEEVTQARKVLKLEDYHDLNPPFGYKFVPAGDPTLTTKCRELARLDGKTVYKVIVKTIGKAGTELSKQVHRVGFHFPSEIVQRAMTSLGIDLDREDDVLRKHEIWPTEEQGRKGRQTKRSKMLKELSLQNTDQGEVDSQAKAAILDMFPAIPMDNLYQIILHAFELGTDRVGVQLNDLSLPRRVQLAVVAHIRHVYTEYDSLLRSHPWAEARSMVGGKTLEILAKWRGDKDDNVEEVEDILREVLVISDDEDEPQDVVPKILGTLEPKSSVDHSSQLLHTASSGSRLSVSTQGKSDRAGARKQIWLSARERRKEPVPLIQSRTNHVYYMPQSGHEPPRGVDSDQYEKRLKGLETYPRREVENQQPLPLNQDKTYPNLLQQVSQQIPLKEHQNSRQDQISRYNTNNQSIQPLLGMTARSGNVINTPPRTRLSLPQNKLAIPANEDIMPSIETPKADRAPVSSFAHGAIHIDSPPSENRPDFRFLRQESIDSSPVRRKRERSPLGQTGSNLRELAYRSGRELQYYHSSDREHHDYGRSQSNRLMYIPLDSNQSIHSTYQDHREPDRYSVHRSSDQTYPEPYGRSADLRTTADHNLRYQYFPLSPVQQSTMASRFPEPAGNSRTTLVPLDNLRDVEPTRHLFSENSVQPLRMIPLDSTAFRSEQQAINEADPRRRNTEAYAYNEIYPRQAQYEPIPYDPHNRQAGLFQQHHPSPRNTYEHRR